LVQNRSSAILAGKAAQLGLLLQTERPSCLPSRHILDGLNAVTVGRGEYAFSRNLSKLSLAISVPDRFISGTHARLLRFRRRWLLQDAGAKNPIRVNGQPVTRAVLMDGDIIEFGGTFFRFASERAAHRETPDLSAGSLPPSLGELRTFNAQVADALGTAARVARSDLAVVISGATGTGKEVVARAIHDVSGRQGPFVPVNCGALPAGLVESMLFGHRRGAFSGADHNEPGLIRSADGGTLFLDELAELPAPAQVALLRVLQDSEILGVGETRSHRVNVRFIAAAQRPVAELVAEGRIRADLAARIGGLELQLPTLEQRREDLGLLIRAFLPPGARLSPPAARSILRHTWPQNIRELEKALRVAAVLAGGAVIEPDHLPSAVCGACRDERTIDDRLRDELAALLTEAGGNMAEVARAMGKAPTQVQRWVKRLGLDMKQFRR
jgi:DNA-binding NtrC family response regulator